MTSFGFSDCGAKGHVGIYTRMTSFEDWVTTAISNNATDENNDIDESKYIIFGQNFDQYRTNPKTLQAKFIDFFRKAFEKIFLKN
jgi:secreted trypsin-like serine protease